MILCVRLLNYTMVEQHVAWSCVSSLGMNNVPKYEFNDRRCTCAATTWTQVIIIKLLLMDFPINCKRRRNKNVNCSNALAMKYEKLIINKCELLKDIFHICHRWQSSFRIISNRNMNRIHIKKRCGACNGGSFEYAERIKLNHPQTFFGSALESFRRNSNVATHRW